MRVLMAEVMNAIKHKEYYKKLYLLKRENKYRDPLRYCTYHLENGHTTEECHQLRTLIESLIKEGNLKKIVDIGDLANEGKIIEK